MMQCKVYLRNHYVNILHAQGSISLTTVVCSCMLYKEEIFHRHITFLMIGSLSWHLQQGTANKVHKTTEL